jgi:electron transfer flavoprotein beta subunit
MLRGAYARVAAGILGPASGQRGVEDPVHVVVLVKYVPEPQGTPSLGDDLLLVREGVDGALDPGDEFAVEASLQLVEAHGGEVTLVSMGPEVATSALRKGFSMGREAGCW